jgi:hypothetical protein
MAIKPVKRSMPIIQGADLNLTFTWRSAGTPVNLTGATARLQVRSDIDSPDVLLELTTENGGIQLGGAAGTVRRYMNATGTAALTWTEGVYDMEIIFADGSVRRLLAGNASVSREVTRSAP